MDVFEARYASDALEVASRYQKAARRNWRNGWLPVALFGIAAIGSVPLYRVRLTCKGRAGSCAAGHQGPALNVFGGIYPADAFGRWLSLYWIASILGVYALMIVHYRRRASAIGVLGRTLPTVSTGLFVLSVVLIVASLWSEWLFVVGFYGTGPLIIVALSLFVLSRTERSVAMAIVSAGFAVVVMLSLAYNMDDALRRIGLGALFRESTVVIPNILVPALFLIASAIFLKASSTRQQRVDRSTND